LGAQAGLLRWRGHCPLRVEGLRRTAKRKEGKGCEWEGLRVRGHGKLGVGSD